MQCTVDADEVCVEGRRVINADLGIVTRRI